MNQSIYIYISYFSSSIILALLVVPLMRPLSFRLRAIDRGAGRRVHDGLVPRLGGVGIYLAFIIPMIFILAQGEWDSFHFKVSGILIGSTAVFLVGIYDDLKSMSVRRKILVETAAALLVYLWGVRITGITNPFGGVIVLGWFAAPVTIAWIVAITNAVNIIDGLDGLAAGTVILISGTLFVLSGSGDISMKLTFVILIGSLLGFLRYNLPPATIFMGDSGSLFLGFFLGSYTILSSSKAAAAATMILPIIAFAHPLTEMIWAIMRRYYNGVPIVEADKGHIHHRLLEKGMSRKRVLLNLYLINVVIMLVVLSFVHRKMEVHYLGLVGIAVLAIMGLRLFGFVEIKAFARENLKNFYISRKKRYFNYLISKFRHNVYRSRTHEEGKSLLTDLVRELGFSCVEIRVYPPIDKLLYSYRDDTRAEKAVNFEFPIRNGKEIIGHVRLAKEMEEDYLLCASELAMAISECIDTWGQVYTLDSKLL